jgi:hypothetical protein
MWKVVCKKRRRFLHKFQGVEVLNIKVIHRVTGKLRKAW